MEKQGILVVSFGTSYEETRKQSIGKIEETIRTSFPEHKIYRAFTSPRIRQMMRNKGESIKSVEEALEEIKEEGIEKLVIQPTFIINGREYDAMCESTKAYQDLFKSFAIGKPLLNTTEDYFKVARAFTSSLGRIAEDEAIICMGHGTEHYMSISYAALDYVFKEREHKGIYMATIEAYPGIENVITLLKEKSYSRVRIVPFMIVAGHHAEKDMKGETGWEEKLRHAGYEVTSVMRGLGEIKEIRELFVEHIKACFR